MIASRRRAALPLVLIGLVALCASLVFVSWVVQAQSQEVTPTADPTGDNPPAVPMNLQATAVHDSVTLTWTASTDQTVTHYAILRRNPAVDASQVFHVIESNAGSGTSYADGTVSASATYIYRVKSVSPTGVSRWSGYVQADTPAAPEPTPTATSTATPTPEPESTPADLAPSNLTAAVAEGGGVTLSWTAPAEDADSVTGYEILRAVGEGEIATLVADTASTATSYTDSTANAAGETYGYRVKALRDSEASLWSDLGSIELPADYEAPQEEEPAAATTPGAPGLSLGAISTSTSIILSWSAPDDDGGSAVTGYKVEYSEDSGDTWQTLVEDTGTTETEYTHSGLEPETTLHYRVSAINEHGAGTPSGTFIATTLSATGTGSQEPDIFLESNFDTPNIFLEFIVDTTTFVQLDEEPTTVLVKNTGQTPNTITLAPDTTNPKDAQAFTTGSHVYGYTLSSVGISFDAIAAPTTAGSELTVTLNEPGTDGNPDTLLCTLSDPAAFTAAMVNAFDAPTTGTECPMLDPDTTYFIVVERANNNTDAISYKTTLSNDEDSGGADGWSIGHATYYYQSSDSTWGSTLSQSMLIEVNGSAGLQPLLVSKHGGNFLYSRTRTTNLNPQAWPSVHHRLRRRRLRAGLHRFQIEKYRQHRDGRRPVAGDAERGG